MSNRIKEVEHNPLAMLKGGCDAIHKLGNIKRKDDNEFVIHKEDETHYYGSFLEGFGFFDVKIRKEDVRELTEPEIIKLTDGQFYINNTPVGGPIKSKKDIWRKPNE